MIIETGLVKTGLVKTGLVRAISNINQRYFRRNEGTTDYAQFAAPITLAGDFVIEFDVLTTSLDLMAIFGLSLNTSRYISIENEKLRVRINGLNADFTATGISDGRLHKILVSRDVSGNVTASMDSVPLTGGANLGDTLSIDSVYALQNSYNLNGILANLKIWDNGTLVIDMPIDDGGDILANKATPLGADEADPHPTGDWVQTGPRSFRNDGVFAGFVYPFTGTPTVSDGYLIEFTTTEGVSVDNKSYTAGTHVHLLESGDFGRISTGNTGAEVDIISIRQADGYATVINPNAEDWGLFVEQPTLWKGQNLSAPPWDSVDQELLKA